MDDCFSSNCHHQDRAPGCQVSVLSPLGVIEEVQGAVIDVICSNLPPLYRAIYACLNDERCTFEVHRHLDQQRVRAIALHRTSGLKRHMPVFDGGGGLQIPVTPACLGRLLDMFGRPLDGAPPLVAESYRPIVAPPIPLSETAGTGELLLTGIKVIDLLSVRSRRKDRLIRRRWRR